MKYAFYDLTVATVQDICLQWENRNVIEVAWLENLLVIMYE